MNETRDSFDTLLDFLYNVLAAVFFAVVAGFMIWLIYAQEASHKPKAPTCAEAVRVCVATQGAECSHVERYCETRAQK